MALRAANPRCSSAAGDRMTFIYNLQKVRVGNVNSYLDYIREFTKLLERAKELRLSNDAGVRHSFNLKAKNTSKTVILFAPHPDDECIFGGCAIRMRDECDARVVVVPVSLGSNVARKEERLSEIEIACSVLGFSLDRCLINIRRDYEKTGRSSLRLGSNMVNGLIECLSNYKPDYIVYPHINDFNPTHILTSRWVALAAKRYSLMPGARLITCFEGEYWHQNTSPNLLIEISPEQLSQLVFALSRHIGEIRRNPYHITLPMWMVENVRRGSEVVGGKGTAVADFLFGSLYRVRTVEAGLYKEMSLDTPIIGRNASICDLIG